MPNYFAQITQRRTKFHPSAIEHGVETTAGTTNMAAELASCK